MGRRPGGCNSRLVWFSKSSTAVGNGLAFWPALFLCLVRGICGSLTRPAATGAQVAYWFQATSHSRAFPVKLTTALSNPARDPVTIALERQRNKIMFRLDLALGARLKIVEGTRMVIRYRVQEFAKQAGLTAKALRHYERVGLLVPQRSTAGYRLYSEAHLKRLEQIVALKFLGLSLREIRTTLERTPEQLPEALRMQRRGLQERQAQLARAVRAIEAAERTLASDPSAAPEALYKVIEVMKLQKIAETMRRYYSTDEEWEKRREYYEDGPGPEWRILYRDAAALLDEDPASEKVQALANRWLALTIRARNGDPAVVQDSAKAWLNRAQWPAALQARLAEFRLEEVADLIRKAALCARRKYFTATAWAKVEETRRRAGQLMPPTWQTHVDVFHAAEAALSERPDYEHVQGIAGQWKALFEVDSGGDAEVKAGLENCWVDRRNWSPVVRWMEEAVHMMDGGRFDRVADFLDGAATYGSRL
jgi:DNA-binding transcriptional MerR regulator